MAAMDQLQFFCGHKNSRAQKLKNLKSEIIQILQSYSPRYGDLQVMFFSLKFKIAATDQPHKFFLLKFKMVATDQLQLFGGRQNSKKLSIIIHLLQYIPQDMKMCGCFFVFFSNLKWPPRINFNIFVGRKNSKT